MGRKRTDASNQVQDKLFETQDAGGVEAVEASEPQGSPRPSVEEVLATPLPDAEESPKKRGRPRRQPTLEPVPIAPVTDPGTLVPAVGFAFQLVGHVRGNPEAWTLSPVYALGIAQPLAETADNWGLAAVLGPEIRLAAAIGTTVVACMLAENKAREASEAEADIRLT